DPVVTGPGGIGHLAEERADGAPDLDRPAECVTVPEGQLALLARRRGHQHLVAGDVLDAPRGRPQRERLAGTRLVDHLLVELADPAPTSAAARSPLTFGARDEHAVQPAVGDRAARGD